MRLQWQSLPRQSPVQETGRQLLWLGFGWALAFSFTGVVPICSGGETANWDHSETLRRRPVVHLEPPTSPASWTLPSLNHPAVSSERSMAAILLMSPQRRILNNPMRRKAMHSGVEISCKSRGFQLWCCSAMLLFKSRCHSHRSCGHTAHQSRRVLHVLRTSLSLPSCSSC
jgi:hypothetical protein